MSVFSPVLRDGNRVLIRMSGPGVREDSRKEDEARRIHRIEENRAYYDGTQYDGQNALELRGMIESGELQQGQCLPEHKKLHPYSTQIAECLDFVANQLTEGFAFEAESEDVQRVIDATIDGSDMLRNGSDEDIAFDEVIIDGGQAGDVPVEVLWDPVEQTTYWEFWPAEMVEFDVPRGNWVKSVTRRQIITVEEPDGMGAWVEKQVEEKVVWDLAYPPLPEPTPGLPFLRPEVISSSVRECRRQVFYDEEEEPRQTTWLGLPVIPWQPLRVNKKGLKGYRGTPLITSVAISAADRYNANEQQAWLIARYNAHGNLAVVGDQAYIKVQLDDEQMAKDVADVLTFPGGTGVYPILLPTDPSMINHTHDVTSDQIYSTFGLTRVEPDTMSSIGGISGYALEILNRKSDGTLRNVRRVFKTDCISLINLTLDVYAYRSGAVITDDALAQILEDNPELEVPDGWLPEIPFADIDPQAEFPARKVDVRMGTGYIVDDVQVRDDMTAGLISQEEALRQRGYDDTKIERILSEQQASAERKMRMAIEQFQKTQPVVAIAGQTKDQTAQSTGAAKADVKASGTQSGSTTGSSNRK
jgi:hypothetical protein